MLDAFPVGLFSAAAPSSLDLCSIGYLSSEYYLSNFIDFSDFFSVFVSLFRNLFDVILASGTFHNSVLLRRFFLFLLQFPLCFLSSTLIFLALFLHSFSNSSLLVSLHSIQSPSGSQVYHLKSDSSVFIEGIRLFLGIYMALFSFTCSL